MVSNHTKCYTNNNKMTVKIDLNELSAAVLVYYFYCTSITIK